MKRSRVVLIISLIISFFIIAYGGLYLYKYLRRWAVGNIEREQLQAVDRDIVSYKSLGFLPDSHLLVSLEQYSNQLKKAIAIRDKNFGIAHQATGFNNVDQLIIINKKMLKSYMRDLQEYRRIGIKTTDNLMRFCYDKVVRLTLALAELEKNKIDGIAQGEYSKKVQRMREIILQSIAHNKNSLRNQLARGLSEADESIASDRKHLTDKIADWIALNKVLYL